MWYSLGSLGFQRHNSIMTATERGLDSEDVYDSPLQINRLEEPQPRALGGPNRVHELYQRFCGPKCHCPCHQWQVFQSPSILKGVIGSLQIIHNIRFWLIQKCEDVNCSSQTAEMSYMFPGWFCYRMITLRFSRSLGSKWCLSLRQIRVRPFTSSLSSAAAQPHGLEYMVRLLKEDPRTVNEVDANGDTALHVSDLFVSLKLPC